MDDVTKTEKMLRRKEGRVGYVIFNNPERHNAVSLDMWAETSRILEDYARDDEVRVVVLTGAGGKAFVSGADISKFESERATLDATRTYNATVEKAYSGIQEFSKRRAWARGVLRPAHLLREFTVRSTGSQAWAGLFLCGPATADRRRRTFVCP